MFHNWSIPNVLTLYTHLHTLTCSYTGNAYKVPALVLECVHEMRYALIKGVNQQVRLHTDVQKKKLSLLLYYDYL